MAKGNTNKHIRLGQNMADILTLELLREQFILIGDKLFWNPSRPKSHFERPHKYIEYLERCAGREAGTPSASVGYNQVQTLCLDGKRRLQYAHRIIYALTNNQLIPAGMVVDHRDTDKKNNNPSNLRLVTVAVNTRNRKPNAGKLHGATLIVTKSSTYWIARHNGKRIDKIKYDSAETAAKARDAYIVANGLQDDWRLNTYESANDNFDPKEIAQ